MRILHRRHAAPVDLDDCAPGAVVPTTPRRFGTAHTPADGSRLHPSRMHFERLLSGGHQHALLKCDPYGDVRDKDGDDVKAVSRGWDVPTTTFRRPASASRAPPAPTTSLDEKACEAGFPHEGSHITARPRPRPRSAAIGRPTSGRKRPKEFPNAALSGDSAVGEDDAVGEIGGKAESTTDAAATPERQAPHPSPRRAKENVPVPPLRPTSAGGDFGRMVGREAPLPGYMALLGAPTAATVAQVAASRRALENNYGGAASPRGAISLAEAEHGAPFAWLSTFDASKTSSAIDPNVPSARLGSGFTFAWQPPARRSPSRSSHTTANKRPPTGKYARPPQIEVRGVRANTTAPQRNSSKLPRPPPTQWHAGMPTHMSRDGLCPCTMAKESSRESNRFAAQPSSSSVGMPLHVLEKTTQASQRHVATTDIGKQTPRPPLEFKSSSMGISLFVKHTLVEPTVLTPRFAHPNFNRTSPTKTTTP